MFRTIEFQQRSKTTLLLKKFQKWFQGKITEAKNLLEFSTNLTIYKQ